MKVHNEPPKVVRGKVDWPLVAQTAEENPGLWVEVDVPLSTGMYRQFNEGQIKALDPNLYEMTSRLNADNERIFYVRRRISG